LAPIDARPLGQILLIESLVTELPDKASMLRFTARGMEEVPGIEKVWFQDELTLPNTPGTQTFEIRHKGHLHSVLCFKVMDEALFSPYAPYIKNLAFMLGIVLDERIQREENERYKTQLESLVEVRTQALLESEARAHSMLRTALDGVWLLDTNASLVEVNEAACTMLGYYHDEMMGMGIDKIEAQYSAEEIQARLLRIRQHGSDLFESQHRRKDGSKFSVEVSVTFLPELNQFVAFLRNITERKRIEEEFTQVTDLLEKSHALSKMGAWTLDLRTNHLTWTPGAYRLHEVDPTIYIPTVDTAVEFYEAECRPIILHAVRNATETGQGYDLELRIRSAKGRPMWIKTMGNAVFEEGRCIRLLGTIQDITERKAHERELLRLNHLYEMLSQLGQTLVRIGSRETLLQEMCDIAVFRGGFRLAWVGWVDAATNQVLPVAKAGQAVDYLEGIIVRVEDFREGHGPTGISIRENRTCVCQDFSTSPIMMPWKEKAAAFGLHASVAVPIRAHGQAVGALTVYSAEPDGFQEREVTLLEEAAAHISFGLDHIASEEQRRKLEAELTHTQKMESLGSLAGGVAHDMNNVLGAILGLASMQMDEAPDDSALKKNMETITKACRRGATLVKGLLGFARQGLAEEKVLNLNVLVQESVALLERTTLQKVHLHVDLANDLSAIQGDPGALSHALLNLCVNAVDAMPQGGTLTLTTRNEADNIVLLEIADTGTGMPKAILDKAMEPFFTTKPQGKGTGLGLSIVYGAIKAHHGKVEIQSELGTGTRVILRFPSCKSPAQDIESDSGSRRTPKQRTLHVLLVDDDELIQQSVREILKSLGHSTTIAASGEEALVKLRDGLSPDLVILDMNMPGMGGARTLPLIRFLLPTVPVFLSTGRIDQMALELVESHQHVTLLAKPFEYGELQQRLESLFMKPQQRPENFAPYLRHVKLLLVDDDEDVRFLTTRMLVKAGYQVITAKGGEEALEILRGGNIPDLIILDQNMIGLSGVQTMGLIRGILPSLPILISSGQPYIEEWECLKNSNVAVLSKPFDLAEIQAKLAQFAIT
jgi:PAS domain S-box-containing protein